MKYKFISLVLTSLLLVSCSKSSQEVHKLEFITIKLEESQSFMKGKELHYEPSKDTIINASNINIKDIISVIETFYNSENNASKVIFRNPKNIKLNLMVLKNDSSISSKDAFNELITFLKRKKLVDF